MAITYDEEISRHVEEAREELADMQILIDHGWKLNPKGQRLQALLARIDYLEWRLTSLGEVMT